MNEQMCAYGSQLEAVLGTYFAPGWRERAASVDGVLAAMARAEPDARLRAALEDLDGLLGRGLCEPQLRDIVLYEFECDFAPERDGLDASAWLRRMRTALSRALDRA